MQLFDVLGERFFIMPFFEQEQFIVVFDRNVVIIPDIPGLGATGSMAFTNLSSAFLTSKRTMLRSVCRALPQQR